MCEQLQEQEKPQQQYQQQLRQQKNLNVMGCDLIVISLVSLKTAENTHNKFLFSLEDNCVPNEGAIMMFKIHVMISNMYNNVIF